MIQRNHQQDACPALILLTTRRSERKSSPQILQLEPLPELCVRVPDHIGPFENFTPPDLTI